MKRLGLAAAAAAFSALILAAPTALAQSQGRLSDGGSAVGGQSASGSRLGGSGKAAAPAAPAAISAADKARGAKEAPALLAASDVKSCQIADAAYRGAGSQKSPEGKDVKVTIYEVACQAGPGYLLVSSQGAPKPQMINCIIASQGSTRCALPGNADSKRMLAAYVQQTGRTCDVSQDRYVGSAASGTTYYEVGCTGAAGFLLSVTEGSPASAIDCLSVQGTPQACQFTSKDQVLAAYQPMVARSGRTCQISDVRPIGAAKDSGDMFTEIACGAQPGFMLQQDKAGAFKAAIDCGKAEGIAGGCKLTDVTTAQTTDAAAYSKLAAKAGFPCQVSKYRFIGTDATNREVVELACSNRPDGALAAFSETGKSDVFDCVRAPAMGGVTCKLTDASIVYPKYTEALAAKGRTTCKVSGANFLGSTQSGLDYVETACADGNPGWVIGFKSGTNTASDLLTCRQASSAGLPCKLPTNTKG